MRCCVRAHLNLFLSAALTPHRDRPLKHVFSKMNALRCVRLFRFNLPNNYLGGNLQFSSGFCLCTVQADFDLEWFVFLLFAKMWMFLLLIFFWNVILVEISRSNKLSNFPSNSSRWVFKHTNEHKEDKKWNSRYESSGYGSAQAIKFYAKITNVNMRSFHNVKYQTEEKEPESNWHQLSNWRELATNAEHLTINQ